jgi:hypothetical protein
VAREDACTGGDGSYHGRGLGAKAGGTRVAGRGASSRRGEEGTIQQEVALRPPVPAIPGGLSSFNPLCHLRFCQKFVSK